MLSEIVEIEFGIVISFIDEHFSKAPLQIFFTDDGIKILSSEEHPQKDDSSMHKIEDGITILLRFEQF